MTQRAQKTSAEMLAKNTIPLKLAELRLAEWVRRHQRMRQQARRRQYLIETGRNPDEN